MAVKTVLDYSVPKRTNEEKRKEYTETILSVTTKLFYEQGYDATTMRQIAFKSGLLIGSVYNIFGSKDDILGAIICSAYDSAMNQFDTLFSEDDSFLFKVAFPLSIYLSSGNFNRNAIEILHASSSSWKVTNSLIDRTIIWMGHYYEKYHVKLSEKETRENLLALFGSLSGFVNKAYYGEEVDIVSEIRTMLALFCTLFRHPMLGLDEVVDRTFAVLNRYSIVFDGKELRFMMRQ